MIQHMAQLTKVIIDNYYINYFKSSRILKKNSGYFMKNFLIALITGTILITLVACSNSEVDNKSSEESSSVDNIETTTEETNNDKITNFQETSFNLNLYKREYKNGEYKVSNLTVPADYDGNPLEYLIKSSFSLTTMDGKNFDAEVEYVLFLQIDGKLVPFSLNESEEKMFYQITMKTNEEQEWKINFEPYGAKKGETHAAYMQIIPLGEYSLECSNALYQTGNLLNNIQQKLEYTALVDSDKGYEDKEVNSECYQSVENFYGDKLMDSELKYVENAVENKEEINSDFMFNTDLGLSYTSLKYGTKTYMDEAKEQINYTSILICDDQIYEGFDGEVYLNWKAKEGTVLNYLIDADKLEAGEHEMYTILFNNDKNYYYKTQKIVFIK